MIGDTVSPCCISLIFASVSSFVIAHGGVTNHSFVPVDFHLPQLEVRVRSLDETKSKESDMDRLIQVKILSGQRAVFRAGINGGAIYLSDVSIRRVRKRSKPRKGQDVHRSSSVPSWVLPSQISWLNVI